LEVRLLVMKKMQMFLLIIRALLIIIAGILVIMAWILGNGQLSTLGMLFLIPGMILNIIVEIKRRRE